MKDIKASANEKKLNVRVEHDKYCFRCEDVTEHLGMQCQRCGC